MAGIPIIMFIVDNVGRRSARSYFEKVSVLIKVVAVAMKGIGFGCIQWKRRSSGARLRR